MKRYALLVAVVFAGCIVNPRPNPEPRPEPDKPNPPSVITIKAVDLFAAMADQITADPSMQSDELVWVVRRELATGRLTQADVDKFNAALPGLAAKNRALTAADAVALRGLK